MSLILYVGNWSIYIVAKIFELFSSSEVMMK